LKANLAAITSQYPVATSDQLRLLADDYEGRRSQDVLDVASLAADVAVDDLTTLGLEPEANPELWASFKMAYPNVDPASLVGRAPESLQGFVNGVKGKYFEVLVARRLNEDRIFGELVLEPGQRAILASSPTQKGWDIQIANEDGSVAELIQLKATTRLSYIKSALEKGFPVATTSEINASSEEILGTPLSSNSLSDEAREQFTEAAESPLDDALDNLAELGIDAVPVFAPVVILVTEGKAVLAGRSTVRSSLRDGARRIGTATAFSALGAGLSALDAGIISVPTTIAARITWGRYTNYIARGTCLMPLNMRLAEVRAIYAS
jgi:hypothetical protein